MDAGNLPSTPNSGPTAEPFPTSASAASTSTGVPLVDSAAPNPSVATSHQRSRSSSGSTRPLSLTQQPSSSPSTRQNHAGANPRGRASTSSSPTRTGVRTTSPSPTPHAPPRTAVSSVGGRNHAISTLARIKRYLRDCKYLILATSIYAVALGVTWTVSYKHTLLGAVSFNVGLLLLVLLSKSGDVAFALATNELFENILWGRAQEEVLPMQKVLALSTSTSVNGLWSMITSRPRKFGSSKRWAFARLWAIVIAPGPGLLLMAYVNPQDYYYASNLRPVNTTGPVPYTVSAGIGAYQPAAAELYAIAARTYVPFLIQSMLQDTSISFPVTAVSRDCLAVGDNCTSAILSAGIQNIKPWPNLRADIPDPYMMVHDTPSYQIDYWSSQGRRISSSQCHVYGSTDSTFELCIDDSNSRDGRLEVGWRSCAPNASTSDLTYCGDRSATDTFVTMLSWTGLQINVWNRTVTQVISTRDGTIQRLDALGEPQPVHVRAADLFSTLDELLWPSGKNSTLMENTRGLQWYITTFLAQTLEFQVPTLSSRIGLTRAAEQALCNAVIMPLFLFHSLFMGTDTNLGLDETAPQPGLGAAFYVKASYAYVSTRATPAFWTVLAYAIVGSAILAVLLLGQLFAMQYPESKKSSFPLLDLGANLKVITAQSDSVAEAQAADEQSVSTSFPNAMNPGDVVRQATTLSVVARAT